MKMERNEELVEIMKRKVEFYYSMNLKCHIKLKPMVRGFVDGKVVSGIVKEGSYFMFEELRKPGKAYRIFLDEVFDIKDYEEVVG